MDDLQLPLEHIKQNARILIAQGHANALVHLAGGYTVAERDTWPRQVLWAYNYVNAQASLITALTSAVTWLVTQAESAGNEAQSAQCVAFNAAISSASTVEAARITAYGVKLTALLTVNERAAINAENGDPALIMAGKILAKTEAGDQLIVMAANIRRTADEGIALASSEADVNAALITARQSAQGAEAAFLAAQSQ